MLKNRTKPLSEDVQLIAFLLAALALRFIFYLPFYLTSDLINYLNALDAFVIRDLADAHHFVRFGMILPSAILNLLDFHSANIIYGMFTSLGTVWITYRLGNEMGGAITAQIATSVVVLAPMNVCLGPVFLPDGPLTFYALSAFYLTRKIVLSENKTFITPFFVGVLIGVAYTCKVNALFFAIPAAFLLFFGLTHDRRWQVTIIFCIGVGLVIIGELIVLRYLLDEWYIRIWETLGFISGSKGNNAGVDKTLFWWLEQIWLKIGAFFWADHIPTAVMFSFIPHLYLGAIWKLRYYLKNHYGLLIWGLTWISQHMLISPQEQEPRYMQAAIPFVALVIGLGFKPLGEKLSKHYKTLIIGCFSCINLACAGIFYATFSPISYATESYINRLKTLGENTYLDGPSEYEIRLAHYAGVITPYTAKDQQAITHWARLSYGYTKERDKKSPPPSEMKQIYHKNFESPLKPIFHFFNLSPGVGGECSLTIYSP